MSWARIRKFVVWTVPPLVIGAGLTVAGAPASALVTGSESLATGATATTVYPGVTDQPAASVLATFSNTYSTGDVFTFQIEPDGKANSTAASAVTFASTPTVTVGGGATGDTVPTFKVSEASSTAGITDELVVTMTNSAAGTPTDSFTFTVSGISYDVGASAGAASPQPYPVDLAASYTAATPSGSSAVPLTNSPVTNANLYDTKISEPATGVAEGSASSALSDLAITGSIPGALAAGAYTVTPSAGTFAGSATVTATGFTVTTVPTGGSCPAVGGSSTATISPNASGDLQFCLVNPSNGSAGGVTLSGLTYKAPSATTGAVTVKVTDSANSDTYETTQPAITVVDNPRISGYTADDTAAAAAESLYSSAMNGGDGGAVILASDSEYEDALSASYLGHSPLSYRNISTGATATMSGPVPILLNPVNPPAAGESTTAAAAAIKALGASTVYVVGGPYVISASVVSQLEQIVVGKDSSGNAVNLQVVRVAGQTAEETSEMVATTPTETASDYSLPATPAAYGLYNNGYSESSSGPTTGTVPTAILVDAGEFQDALAASPLAYAFNLPVLLNAPGGGLDPNAATAIQTLGIQQVIVVGGYLAVSDQTVSTLEGDNISVLRIAGATFDATAANLASFELSNYAAPTNGVAGLRQGLDSTATENGGPGLTIGTSRGDSYQDALSASQVLGDTKGSAVSPLLLNTNTSTLSAGTAGVLGLAGTAPAGGLTVYDSSGTATVEHVLGDVVFGGTLAQTPALVASELDAIAQG